MINTMQASGTRLSDLAPCHLTNYRAQRYHGEDLCLAMEAFTADDQSRLRELYGNLQDLLLALSPRGPEPVIPKVLEFANGAGLRQMMQLATELGRASYAAQPSTEMAKTIHDLRGGGLTPLLGQLHLVKRRGLSQPAVDALFYLTRDHLKIMRNALVGLDDPKRHEDLLPRVHTTDLILEKWQGTTLHEQGRDMRLEVECPLSVAVGECCAEFGAIDRILYNLISNATRHASDNLIRLAILPVPDDEGLNIRFVLLNALHPDEIARLRKIEMTTLFDEGTSTTGSGFGLAIVSDFICHAYGLTSRAEAVQGGYLGATLLGGSFAAWFHWPRVIPAE